MDRRLREHARVLADHSLRVERGETVLIQTPLVAEPLVTALAAVLGERGASPMVIVDSGEPNATYLRALEGGTAPEPTHMAAAVEEADAVVDVKGAVNRATESDVPSETMAAYAEAMQPVVEAMTADDWVATQYPAPGAAQAAAMSTAAYREFVADAVTLDWETQHAFQQRLVDRLDPADEVHVRSEGTDLRFSVEGMAAGNEDGRKNLPGGEVGITPVPESVEGTVLFDLPVVVHGTTVEDATVSFQGGEVVEYRAARGEDALAALLATDDGARRLGEFGVGMNRAIERPTRNVLFDEKMGDTAHFAFGHSLPPDGPGNDSAVHVDMLVDMRTSGTVEVDDETVYADGAFRWEEAFDE